ncbi:MAG TPA: hypothetical protein VIF62_18225 [Labilithrix sp.]
MRRLTLVGILATAMLVAAPAAAQRARKPPPPPPSDSIEVAVVDVAGSQAFLKPGAAGGVHRGAIVRLHGKEFTVVQTTSTYAVIDIGDLRLREDEKGRATIVAEEEAKPRELPKPKPLATWQQAWTPPPAPASAQTPKYVPLGESERERRYDVRLAISGGAMLPLAARSGSPGIGNAQLDARVHAEPIQAPMSIDLDLTLQRWFASNLDARDGRDTRPLLWVREALVGYSSGGYYAGLGRMRYAASTLGTLDGARVRAPLGSGFGIGAFGGVLPNPLGGEPSLDAQRFGVEATYSRPEIELRPEAALVVHGSTFGGSLDERRISGVVGLYPGLARLGGHFEVSNFASGNPWKASPIELTAGGLDASVRTGIFQFGARVDARQPERSNWLASYLPTSWFCRTVAPPPGAPPGTPEPCDGSVSTRALGQLDASVEVGHVSAMIGATRIADLTQAGGSPDMSGGFLTARLVRIARILRIDASGSYTRSSFAEMYGGSGGPGLTLLGDNLDVSGYFRWFALKYPADPSTAKQSGFGGVVMIFPNAEVLFTAQGEAVEEIGTKMLVLFGTAMWRPRF